MEYIKARAFVEAYDVEDIISNSGSGQPVPDDCDSFAQYDLMYCDGSTNSVDKSKYDIPTT